MKSLLGTENIWCKAMVPRLNVRETTAFAWLVKIGSTDGVIGVQR